MINIGPEQQRKRRILGLWGLAAGAAVAIGCWVAGVSTLVRLAAAPLLFGGFLGVLQARERT
jgi:hypothetical protein